MGYPKPGPRHFEAGWYICPVRHLEVPLEAAVPRVWVHWPVRVGCVACGEEHVLQYDDVRQKEPAFGHE
jgi:hypothetical protein